MANTERMTIRALHQEEISKLLADNTYSRFIPVKCNSCGRKNGFNRCIFQITGVAKKNYADEATQNMLSYHFLHQHKIEYTFFRSNSGKFYADSASCQSCKSTAIVFDLVLDDVMMAEYTKAISGVNGESQKRKLRVGNKTG